LGDRRTVGDTDHSHTKIMQKVKIKSFETIRRYKGTMADIDIKDESPEMHTEKQRPDRQMN